MRNETIDGQIARRAEEVLGLPPLRKGWRLSLGVDETLGLHLSKIYMMQQAAASNTYGKRVRSMIYHEALR